MDGLTRSEVESCPREIIFPQGQVVAHFFILESGEVEIVATNNQSAAQIESKTAKLCLFCMIWRSLFCDPLVSMELFSLDQKNITSFFREHYWLHQPQSGRFLLSLSNIKAG